MSEIRDPHAGPGNGPTVEEDRARLVLALGPDHRFRCDACGNVTRFDVIETATTRRYQHFDLGGDSWTEDEEVLERSVRSVTCRWCGRDDRVQVEPAPVAGT